MLSLVMDNIKAFGAAALAALAGIAYIFAYNKGKQKAEDKQTKAKLEAIENRGKVDEEVGSLSSGDLDTRVKRWVRD